MAGVSSQLASGEKRVDKLVLSINQLAQGRGDNRGTVTLTPGATSTAVANQFAGENSSVMLFPRSASAAAAFGAGAIYVSAKINGGFTLTHDNQPDVDRTFDFIFVG